MIRRLATVLAVAALAVSSLAASGEPPADGRDDVVVVAVVDSGFNLYHHDFYARYMPQHLDQDPSNDLPLTSSPDTWVPGFPDPASFGSYERLDLTLPDTGSATTLRNADNAQWNKVRTSDADRTHYSWVPDSKVIGVVNFGSSFHSNGTPHGMGTSSVSVGNLHGSCPQCVVVLVSYGNDGEAASRWVQQQDWIDVVTNSWGYSAVMRDRLYSGSDTEIQREASERGQTIFFSAGNGQANTFTVPNTTIFSSQEGPDWIVTVGAIHPDGHSFSGHGKPADVSSLGTAYPSANGTSVDARGTFSGTSNSTPVVAGMYANTLARTRATLDGPSKIQQDGVIATGTPIACGDANPDCELGDGELTAVELRTRLLHGAVHTPQGWQVSSLVSAVRTPATQEMEFLAEGHGSYFGRFNGNDAWEAELDRIAGPMDGSLAPLARPDGEAEWFTVDSYCRQQLWGTWADGYWTEGDALPGPDPLWPTRSAWETSCPHLFPPR